MKNPTETTPGVDASDAIPAPLETAWKLEWRESKELPPAEGKQLNESLERNERLISAILKTLPLSLWYVNGRGEVQLANPADETLWTGVKKPGLEEMASYKDWLAALQSRIRDEKWALARAVSEGISTLHELKEVVCWDGTRKTILHSAVPLLDSNHSIHGAIAVNEDITERKRAEATLRESEIRFRQVVENITEVFWMTNLERSRVLYVSPGYEKLWGRHCGELYESPRLWIEAIHPNDRDRVLAKWSAFTPGVGEYHEEYRIVRPDGSERWIRDRAFPVNDADGALQRIVGIAEDVTQFKRMEEELRKNEAELRVTFENAAIGIALVNTDGNPIKSNRALQRMLGYSEAELQHMRFTEFTHPDDVQTDMELYCELMAGKREQYQVEKRYLRKDGEIVSGRLTVSVVRGAANEPIYAIGMVEDVTEKKKLELQFMRSQRIECIGALAGGIAHDLNNVLAPILMSCELLKQYAGDEATEKLLSIIHASAKRGTDLVRQVVSFARGTPGGHTTVQLGNLIREVATIARETFPKSITVRTVVPENLWSLRGDPAQLHQVLLNLCINARDAMPKGGDLSITTNNFAIDAPGASANPEVKPGRYVVMKVRDTGVGISPEIQDRIFDPFFTTKDPGKGTGLGLSTALGIVKTHGGFISLSSTLGKGAAFEIWLPALADGKSPAVQLDDVEPARGQGELILVVDDEAAVRSLTKQTLEAYGYRVLTASDGFEAVGIYADQKDEIKAVITDMMMPVLDGRVLIRALVDINPAVPMIALSGSFHTEHHVEPLEARAMKFLPKPCNVETLLTSLHEILGIK
ncbi:MAG TPA: PAS domain S-box protein [Verrucomicrobiae bacterium]|nr:PAS domain S-box protein [Verrucomicrobiae bacterium]